MPKNITVNDPVENDVTYIHLAYGLYDDDGVPTQGLLHVEVEYREKSNDPQTNGQVRRVLVVRDELPNGALNSFDQLPTSVMTRLRQKLGF